MGLYRVFVSSISFLEYTHKFRCEPSITERNSSVSFLKNIHVGPGCSKLTTSLVNETLKFQTLISQICQYFLLKKCETLLQCKSISHFINKNISVFGYEIIKHLTS